MGSPDDIVIVGMARTPFGSFQGSLASVPAPKLGATAIKGALERAGLKPEKVSEVIMGNVLSAGVGQAPARQAAIYAGVPQSAPCMTVNKVCGSGMKTLALGMQSLKLGDSDVVVAGGMENMSQAPYLLKNARSGWRMGDGAALDSMIHDGLQNPYDQKHMGLCGELCARDKGISREEQDQFAISSFKRAIESQEQDKFQVEITPIEVPGRKGSQTYNKDEGPTKVKFDKIPTLRPVFEKDGSITAANASTINDGACACVMTRRETAEKMGLKPIAKLVAFTHHAQAPEWFTTAPIEAMKKAMDRTGWSKDEIDLFEVNEAFAVVTLAAEHALEIPHEKMNTWGGAIALGHPIGASGTRIVMTLISALRDQGKKRGLAGICIGGGEAMAMAVEVE